MAEVKEDNAAGIGCLARSLRAKGLLEFRARHTDLHSQNKASKGLDELALLSRHHTFCSWEELDRNHI